ncbi:hypothetical protein Vafri_9017, partial [Volvox africanus]
MISHPGASACCSYLTSRSQPLFHGSSRRRMLSLCRPAGVRARGVVPPSDPLPFSVAAGPPSPPANTSAATSLRSNDAVAEYSISPPGSIIIGGSSTWRWLPAPFCCSIASPWTPPSSGLPERLSAPARMPALALRGLLLVEERDLGRGAIDSDVSKPRLKDSTCV